MNYSLKNKLNEALERLSDLLDISENHYKQAVERYQAIGGWLAREESTIAKYDPKIYPQGSFLLGTIVKPITDIEDYDIDLVCELDLTKKEISQKQLKDMVGNEVKRYAETNNMKHPPREGNRCWTLEYAEGAQFHMDILPALPDRESFKLFLESKGFSPVWTEFAIAITDKRHKNYEKIDEDWLRSNPKGYAMWFKKRMKVQFERQRKLLAESIKANIEDVPEYKVKTPLQRAIQILKRHRDIMFVDDQENKPISIIITTLAAHAYNNEDNLLEALINIVNGMPKYIQYKQGKPWISNPVNPTENFADKWIKNPKLKEKFEQWLKKVKTNLEAILSSQDLHNIIEGLKPKFGDRIINEVASELFPDYNSPEDTGKIVAPYIKISNPSKPWREKFGR